MSGLEQGPPSDALGVPAYVPTHVNKATDINSARSMVRQAQRMEHQLYLQVCAMNCLPAKGMRGFENQEGIAECLEALRSHEKKIRQYQSVLVNRDQNLKDFNTLAASMGLVNDHTSAVGEIEIPESVRESGWLFRLWCWWNFKR